VLEKVKELREWRDANGQYFRIMVDGGVSSSTSAQIISAGADTLVSGSFLFDFPGGIKEGIKMLMGGSAR
jgi:pentose-5-phosphate-3-epimerase